MPDDYQGESVQAFVTLRNGQDVTDDLPKTATGKILRRELRAR